MASAPSELMVTVVPKAMAPAAGLNVGVVWAEKFQLILLLLFMFVPLSALIAVPPLASE